MFTARRRNEITRIFPSSDVDPRHANLLLVLGLVIYSGVFTGIDLPDQAAEETVSSNSPRKHTFETSADCVVTRHSKWTRADILKGLEVSTSYTDYRLAQSLTIPTMFRLSVHLKPRYRRPCHHLHLRRPHPNMHNPP